MAGLALKDKGKNMEECGAVTTGYQSLDTGSDPYTPVGIGTNKPLLPAPRPLCLTVPGGADPGVTGPSPQRPDAVPSPPPR